MNTDILKGNWTQLKGKIKQQWGKLTDDDIQKVSGSFEVLQGKLQEIYGYQREEAKKQIDAFLEKQNVEPVETVQTTTGFKRRAS